VVLTGDEIKSIRAGKASLADSYVLVRAGEAFLINAHIAAYDKGAEVTDPKKDRKLLLHKNEVEYLAGKLSGANLAIVPLRLYFKRNYAKIELALARGKKKADKRETLRRKAIERDIEAGLRSDKLKAQQEKD
jgi:SsrA-binding protein